MLLGAQVELSKRSQKLIAEFKVAQPTLKHLIQSLTTLESLTAWLNDEGSTETITTSSEETGFLLASLRAELLHDLFVSMNAGYLKEAKIDAKGFWFTKKTTFILLACAGTLLAACEGFDGITTMLSLLSLPSLMIFITGLTFSILSIVVFYSYDLVQLSKNLGVSLTEAPKLLDVYLLQLREIKNIRKKIETYKLIDLPEQELIHWQKTVAMLQKRFNTLTTAGSEFDSSLNSNKIRITKIVIESMAGLIFFGSGFFVGQSVGIFMTSVFIPAALPTSLPVVLFSVVVGLAAFSLYWHLDRTGLKKLISGWFGLDEEKVDRLCNKNKLNIEKERLQHLSDNLSSIIKLIHQVELSKRISSSNNHLFFSEGNRPPGASAVEENCALRA